MPARLNARVDDALTKKIALLRKHTQQTVTEIVRASIDLYFDSKMGGTDRARRGLVDAGFIGCGSGPADLSTSYKQELADLLVRKT